MKHVCSLLAITAVLMAGQSSAKPHNLSTSRRTPLRMLLQPDGTIKRTRGFRGNIDPTGWQMKILKNGFPRFVASGNSVDTFWNPSFPGNGTNGAIYAMALVDTDLYLGGAFTSAGGVSVNNIARWDGTSWFALGSGSDNGVNGIVRAFAVVNTDLYVGGSFTTSGGSTANRVARWDGSAWFPLGDGVNDIVYALTAIDTDLYAGGQFTMAGGSAASGIAHWDGVAWSALGSGVDGPVYSLANDGVDLFAGGNFTSAGGSTVNRVAMWDGLSWNALGAGMDGAVYALVSDGVNLFAGGDFLTANGTISVNRIAVWDGASWSPLGGGTNGTVRSLDLNPPDLYAGGAFTTANGISSGNIARWDGTRWSALGSGADDTICVIATDTKNIFAGGAFSTAGTTVSNHLAIWSAPVFLADAYAIAFDTTIQGEYAVTVYNEGPDSLRISGVASTNSQFTVSPTSAAIASEEGQIFIIAFLPTTTSEQTALILFTHNGATSPDTVAATGTGRGLSIGSAAGPEGNSGTSDMTFSVSLSSPSADTVTATFSTANGTALAGSDFISDSGQLIFLPGDTVQHIRIPIIGDFIPEPDETLYVRLLGSGNAVIIDSLGTGVILNDDTLPPPQIIDVKDVPHDQGGKVQIRWKKSLFDTAGADPAVISYGIWRRIRASGLPLASRTRNAASKDLSRHPIHVGISKYIADTLASSYDFLGNIPATGSSQYDAVTPTLADSTAAGIYWFTYLVIANTTDSTVFSISASDSGYSVDNIPPIPPQNLQLTVLPGGLNMVSWSADRADPDLRYYTVYRSIRAGFPISDSTRLTITTDTSTVDSTSQAGRIFFYGVTATDIHGNESSTLPDLSVGVLPIQLATFTASAESNHHIALQWTTVTETNNLGYYIERRADERSIYATVSGLIPARQASLEGYSYQWVDSTIAGGTYYYRLRQVDLTGETTYSNEITIATGPLGVEANDLPTRFGLDQNYPDPFNPSTTIRFSVDKPGWTTVTVHDLLGRKVATVFDALAEPRRYYSLTFDASSLSSGIYLYRIVTEDRTAVRRMVVVK